MDIRHGGETPRKDPLLHGKGLGRDTLIIQKLSVGVQLKLPLNTPPIGLVGIHGGDSS